MRGAVVGGCLLEPEAPQEPGEAGGTMWLMRGESRAHGPGQRSWGRSRCESHSLGQEPVWVTLTGARAGVGHTRWGKGQPGGRRCTRA